MRMRFLLLAWLAGAVSAGASLIVPGTADIWLAGQANGATVTGIFGSDSAPTNSPVALAVIAGHTLTFSVTGMVSNDNGSCFAPSPDGGCVANVSAFGAGPANGLSSFAGPGNALIGVFVSSSVPMGPGAPAGLDFTTPASISFTSLSPLLNQVFFIGDGLSGTGSGVVQHFLVPTGATRLFLGSSDALGANFDNLGSFTVNTSDATVPEPAGWSMLAIGILGLLAFRAFRMTRLLCQ